jgi:hypothetical protein
MKTFIILTQAASYEMLKKFTANLTIRINAAFQRTKVFTKIYAYFICSNG